MLLPEEGHTVNKNNVLSKSHDRSDDISKSLNSGKQVDMHKDDIGSEEVQKQMYNNTKSGYAILDHFSKAFDKVSMNAFLAS